MMMDGVRRNDAAVGLSEDAGSGCWLQPVSDVRHGLMLQRKKSLVIARIMCYRSVRF